MFLDFFGKNRMNDFFVDIFVHKSFLNYLWVSFLDIIGKYFSSLNVHLKFSSFYKEEPSSPLILVEDTIHIELDYPLGTSSPDAVLFLTCGIRNNLIFNSRSLCSGAIPSVSY